MQVSVLGSGFLGRALCWSLIGRGHTVKASTTTAGKLQTMQLEDIIPYLLDLDNASAEDITPFLQGSDVLVINIPPKIKTAATSYPDKMRLLLPHIKTAGITKVVFVSSTSVYADAFPFPVITEATPPNPDAENGRQILEAEKVLQGADGFEATIIRPAGLIGGERHPVHHLAGRAGIANPHAPVNLVHRLDVKQAIQAVIKKNAWGTTFNIAYPAHPEREAYYTAKALQMSLPAPQFNHDAPSTGKIIASEKVQEVLGITFIEEI